MNAPLVLVTSRSFSTGTDDLIGRLNQAGARVVRGAIDHDLKSIRPELENAVAWIAGTSPVTAQHLAAAPKLRLIARYGVGVDAVDRDAAARAGVTVTNTLAPTATPWPNMRSPCCSPHYDGSCPVIRVSEPRTGRCYAPRRCATSRSG